MVVCILCSSSSARVLDRKEEAYYLGVLGYEYKRGEDVRQLLSYSKEITLYNVRRNSKSSVHLKYMVLKEEEDASCF